MGLIVNILVAIGSFIWWLVQKFFPFLIKKFGLSSVKFAIQKLISAFVVSTAILFYAAVIVFINETFTIFRNFLALIESPSSAGFGGAGSEYVSCFFYLMDVSGVSAGFTAAFNFGLSVFIFFFFRGLYKITVQTSKLVSDEIAKNLKLY